MNALTNIESDWFTLTFNMTVVLQFLITAIVVPILLSKLYRTRIAELETSNGLYESSKKRLVAFQASAAIMAILICGVIGQAILNKQELFNWDNQAGLTVLFLLAYLPILVLMQLEKQLNVSSLSVRKASLIRQTWRDFIPTGAIALIVISQLSFVATTIYFVYHPFEGFAGLANLIGLVFIDAVMIGAIAYCLNGRFLQGIEDFDERTSAKQVGVNINLFIWILAVFHISLSLWLAGLDMRQFSLILQSFYFQICFVASVLTLFRKSRAYLNLNPSDNG